VDNPSDRPFFTCPARSWMNGLRVDQDRHSTFTLGGLKVNGLDLPNTPVL
jgi:hypothetical protein